MNVMDDSIVFFFALLALIFLRRMAPGLGLLDRPCERKTHDGHVPLVGGLAIFTALAAHIFFFGSAYPYAGTLLALAVPLVVISALDDRQHISHKIRMVVHAFAALGMVVMADVQLYDLGRLNGELLVLGALAMPLTVFAMVGVINAMNFADGADGLAGGLAFIAIAFMAYMANQAGAPAANFLAVLLVPIFVFLLFNARWTGRRKAVVFLGDAGSVLLGFVIAWFLIELSQGEGRAFRPVTALWFFAAPLIDTVASILRRVMKGRSPFAPDREHLHHILNRLGLNDNLAVLTIYLFALLFGAVGVLGEQYQWSESLLFTAFLGVFFLYYFMLMHAWRTLRLLRTVFADV
jgi:UDP-GlcNAc:undecaprenyl-phosphate GlcNAc-1-phosphate transferase